MNFLLSNAYADTLSGAAPASGQGGGLSFVLMFVVFFVFIYFTVWRPQSKRAKEQQNLLNSVVVGDEVITASGLIGVVTKVVDQYMTVSLASHTDVLMQKNAIVSVLPRGTIKTIV